MKLSAKGRYAPRPELEPAAQRVADIVASWKDVRARTHWLLGDETTVDGADFYLGDEELGHIHLDSEAHVFLPRSVADALSGAGLASPFRWSPLVVTLAIHRRTDELHAVWLFKLSFDRRRGASSSALLARVRQYALLQPGAVESP